MKRNKYDLDGAALSAAKFWVSPQDLALLIRAAELGSFAAVAREREMETSNVSRAIQRLEKTWGVRLVRRSTQGLSLTPEGELALELGRESLDGLRRIGEHLAAPRGEVAGTVRLALSAAYAENLIIPALPRLSQRHPRLQLVLNTDDRVANLPLEGADLALRIGQVTDEDLVARKIGEIRRGLYCAPGYLERRGWPASPDDLAGHELIGHSAARNLNRVRLRVDGQLVERRIEGRYSANTTAMIARMVLQGMGIGNLNHQLVQGWLAEGRLVEVLHDWHDPTLYPVHLVFFPDRQRLPRIQAVIDFLAELM